MPYDASEALGMAVGRAAPNGSAIVLRRGEALELTFRGGRRFAVTVDDAATGAALLNGLVARHLGEG
jgi:hypothetical protein